MTDDQTLPDILRQLEAVHHAAYYFPTYQMDSYALRCLDLAQQDLRNAVDHLKATIETIDRKGGATHGG